MSEPRTLKADDLIAGIVLPPEDFDWQTYQAGLTEARQREQQQAQQRAYAQALSSAGVPKMTDGLTWHRVADDLEADPGKGKAITERLTGVLDGTLSPRAWLYLHGAFGTGKTVAATALFKHLLWLGTGGVAGGYASGVWRKWYAAVREVQAGYSDGTADAKLRTFQSAPLLLIDDLGDVGKAGVTDDQRRLLYEIIDARADAGLQTIITSNLSVAEVAHDFGGRTTERIDYHSIVVELGGKNYRTKPLHA